MRTLAINRLSKIKASKKCYISFGNIFWCAAKVHGFILYKLFVEAKCIFQKVDPVKTSFAKVIFRFSPEDKNEMRIVKISILHYWALAFPNAVLGIPCIWKT